MSTTRTRLVAVAALSVLLLTGFAPVPATGATVEVDEWGVPHVVAGDPLAMAEAYGHYEASQRLLEMDIIRRMGQGRLSEMLGESAYDADVVMRREFYDPASFDAQIAALPQTIRDLLDAYAEGVNRAIAELTATGELPALYAALADAPRPWTAHDSATVLNLFTAVSFAAEGEGGELENIEKYLALQDRYGERAGQVWDDVMWSNDPDAPTVIQDEDAPPAPTGVEEPSEPHPDQLALGTSADLSGVAAALREQFEAAQQALSGLPVPKVGSYAVAFAGDRTASGGGLLLGSPQAGFTFPSTFHEVGIHVPGWDCQGMTVPGLGPFVGIGWCNDHAWTLVAGNAGDQVDVYVEQLDPQDPGRYLHDGRYVPFETRTETFLVKGTVVGTGLDVRQEEYEYSVHGAVFAKDVDAGVAYTTRRAQDGRSVENLVGLYALNTGTDGVAGLLEHVDDFTATYNLTMADEDGHIGYAFTGLQPVRSEGYDRRFAMPGTGEAEWQGFIPREQMPQVLDPESGLIVVSQGVESKSVDWWPASSELQIGTVNRVGTNRELLLAEPDEWTADRLQTANRRLIESEEPFAALFADVIDQALRGAERDPELAELRRHWQDWKASGFARTDRDGDGRYDQVGAAIFQPDRYYGMAAAPMWNELIDRVFADDLPSGFGWGHYFARLSLLDRLLHGERLSVDYVDDRTTPRRERPADVVRDALVASIPALAERYGTEDTSRWTIPITEIGYTAIGIAAPRTMRVLDHGTYSYIVDLGTRDGRSILPPGNGSADSAAEEARFQVTGEVPPHADDQIELYEAWDFKPMYRRR